MTAPEGIQLPRRFLRRPRFRVGFFGAGVGAAAMLALVVGAATLGREPLWDDELASLALVGRPFPAMIRQLPHEHNGVLFDLVLWPIVQLGGTSSSWLRLPALVATVLAVVVCGLVGRRLAGVAAGVLSAFFLAAAPFSVRYAQEARMYGFALLFSVLGVLMLLRAIERPTRLRWLLYSVTVVAAGYSHDFALLPVVAHPILVWGSRSTIVKRRFVGSLGLAALLLVPLAVLAVTDWPTNPLFWVVRPRLGSIRQTAVEMTGSVAGLGVCLAVLLAGAIALYRRRAGGAPGTSPQTLPFLLIWLLGPVALLFVVSQAKPLYVTRYLLPTLPALALLLAIAVTLLRTGVAFVATLATLGVLVGYAVRADVKVTNPDFPRAAAYLRAHRAPGEPVVLLGDSVGVADGLLYYRLQPHVDRAQLPWTTDDVKKAQADLQVATRSGGLTTADVSKMLAGGSGLWIVARGFGADAGLKTVEAWPSRDRRVPHFRGVAVMHLMPQRA